MKFSIISAVAFLSVITITSSEVFTALADLEDALKTESFMIESLRKYIKAQDEKLIILKKYLKTYEKQNLVAIKDVKKYLANPINAYLLVKRLTLDWKQIETLSTNNVGIDFITSLSTQKTYKLPTEEDLNGAASALIRLQDTYKLDTASLARGELNNVKYGVKLSTADCFEIGKQSYNNGDYYHTFLWMREAYQRLKLNANESVNYSDVLEYLAFSSFKRGNTHLALNLTNELLQVTPTHKRALGNKAYYEEELENDTELNKEEKNLDLSFIDKQKPDKSKLVSEFYEQLCRGEVKTPLEISSKLKCYYENNNIDFLRIAPFKVEEAYKDPIILIFHNVISDDEINTVKTLAQPRFLRAGVRNPRTGESEVTNIRISKTAWLKNDDHKHIDNIAKRVGDISDLDQRSAELLQVVNYGIGGHYEPHFDFGRKGETNVFKNLNTGNRIATVLFYMTDVEQGGATVFPKIKVAVWPKKGTAVLWYNLFSSGEGNANTEHASCPVLVGTKWVSNKWIHEHYQEFRRPCELKQPPRHLVA